MRLEKPNILASKFVGGGKVHRHNAKLEGFNQQGSLMRVWHTTYTKYGTMDNLTVTMTVCASTERVQYFEK